MYEENLTINDFSITLKGAYATCADAMAGIQGTDFQQTIISAPALAPAIIITGTVAQQFVAMDHLRITGGTGVGFIPGGGIATFSSDLRLELTDVRINNNNGGPSGGGIAITSNTFLRGYNLRIDNNQAEQGGGIYCGGSGALINLLGDEDDSSGIAFNTATNGDGGGVYLEQGCGLVTLVGTSMFSGGDLRGIVRNAATNDGGGIYAKGGSDVSLAGDDFISFDGGYSSQPVNLSENVADFDLDGTGRGGAIHAEGTGTRIIMTNILIDGNSAALGGGISAIDSATVTANIIDSNTTPDLTCWSSQACNQIINNQTPGNGGAFYLTSNANARIYRTHIQGNRAGLGTAVYAVGTGASFEGESLLITGNGDFGTNGIADNNVLRLIGSASIELAWSTLADNNISNSNEIIDNSSSSLNLLSTIIHEPNPVPIYRSTSPVSDVFDCMVVHEDTSINDSGSSFNIIEDDPEFIDRANGDYHINPLTSPAIDACSGANAPMFNDSDDQPRGYDWPNIADTFGPFDIGYDEQVDLIFADGFD